MFKPVMKCPFRIDRNMEFESCYGPACMAYYEYQPEPVAFGQGDSTEAEQPKVRACMRISTFGFGRYGCN